VKGSINSDWVKGVVVWTHEEIGKKKKVDGWMLV
jgi:hypothetical protein